jgi:hypothetical protein
VYDPDKWAVVFKYTTIDISVNVYFSNHPSGAPVVWLASGDVTIEGQVNLDGEYGRPYFDFDRPFAESGPGGFGGGQCSGTWDQASAGFGPGA